MSVMVWIGVGALVFVCALVLWIVAIRRRINWSPPQGHHRKLALHTRLIGDSKPSVVLLHGLAGSGRYFGAQFEALSAQNKVIVPDLLGFGQSPKPKDVDYDIDDHVEALAQTMEALNLDGPSVIVGHSTGCVIALALAHTRPELVSAVVAFCPPYYADTESATERIGAISTLVKMFALETPLARASCRWMCNHRETARTIAPLLRPDLPTPIARDGVQHTWASYSGTLKQVVLQGHACDWLPTLKVPIQMIAGDEDPVTDLALLKGLARSNPLASLEIWPGNHDLPLHNPGKCVQTIEDALKVRP